MVTAAVGAFDYLTGVHRDSDTESLVWSHLAVDIVQQDAQTRKERMQ